MKTIIEVPEWANIDDYILVKDVDCIRGEDPQKWYKEKILGYGYDGIFHQATNCPVYYSKFSEYRITIKKNK